MITIENTRVFGFEAAIRGARNPKNSWHLSDSKFMKSSETMSLDAAMADGFEIGPNDMRLLSGLAKAGTDHGKFMRMIHVQCDIIAPTYFDAELDTYKIGTTRNSCSLMHKGIDHEYTIRDFSISDERLYEILDPTVQKKEHPLVYPYETDDFKTYSTGDRNYRVYKNGRVIAEAYSQTDSTGRTMHYKEKEIQVSQDLKGYYYMHLNGRKAAERWMLHRLVATVWIERDWDKKLEVNHKDGNKGNNSVENLEWVTHQENEIHKHEHNLSGRTLRSSYKNYLASSKVTLSEIYEMRQMKSNGIALDEIARVYGISRPQAYTICGGNGSVSKNRELFESAELWGKIIERLNYCRSMYKETGDTQYFMALRQLMPMGYNYRFTWDSNYAVLKNIYWARKDHKLKEWHVLCDWIKTLPYARQLICGEV